MAAVYGGMAYAWVVLGLAVPFAPPMSFDLFGLFLILGCMSGGPYVGGLIGTIRSLGKMPTIGIPVYWIHSLGFCLGYKQIWNMKGIKRYVAFIAWDYIWLFIDYMLWGLYGAYIYKWFDFIPFMWTGITVNLNIFMIWYAVPELILMKYAPELVKPRWSWRGGED